MAQRVITELISDLSEEEADETVSFALDGTNYEIDLTRKEADDLRGVVLDYVAKARKVSGARRSGSAKSNKGPSPAEIRDWAKSNGHEVPDRGRIPAAVREAFEAVN